MISWISLREDDPTAKLESPRQGRPLPKILTEAEVDMLLAASHRDGTPEGIRLTCLLELLYATGLRVTELVICIVPDFELMIITAKVDPIPHQYRSCGKAPNP